MRYDHLLPALVIAALTAAGTLCHAAPSIITQPAALAATQGGQAVFSVCATGSGTLTYQWKKDGTPIGGATTAAQVIDPVQYSDAGNYTVSVTDSGGTTASSAAWLSVNAPLAGTVDFGFFPNTTVNGQGNAVAVQGDGKVLIGGSFTTVNGALRGGIARLNSDGSTDHTFGNGLAGAGAYAIVVQSDGKVLVGGGFTAVNGVARRGFARLNSDGTLDTTFGNGMAGTDDRVTSVALQSDGKVLIGGFFGAVNGVWRGHIARLNSDGSLDTTFGNGLAGVNNGLAGVNNGLAGVNNLSMAVQSDGKVLIGGSFTTVNGTARGNIARLNSDGSLDTGFGDGLTGASARVNSVAVQSDGKVLIGGTFTTVNGTARGRHARLNSDGSLDTSFVNGFPVGISGVSSMALQSDGKVLIAGSFFVVNGTPRTYLARLAGVSDTTLAALAQSTGTPTPAFSAGTLSYASTVPNATTGMTVTPAVNGANQSLEVGVNGGTYATVATGTPSGTLALNVGANTIDVRVTASDGTASTYTLTVTRLKLPPSIAAQPVSAVVTVWQPASFTVSVTSGDGPFTYQWRKGGTDLVGATAATYNLNSVVMTDAGSYAVVVTNGGGSVTSSMAVLTVNKATPSVTTWPTASALTYGQTLASSSLSGGVGSVAGSFAFTTPTTAPNAGSASQGVTFTPSAAENYQTVSGSVSVTVSKATPTVSTWPSASAITTVGQALSTSTLSGGSASVTGGFTFTAPATTPPAGNHAAAVTFSPTDTDNFNTVAGSANVVVGLTAVDDTVTRSAQGLTKIAVAQLLANDSDPLGRSLTVSSVSALSGGTVTLSGRWITFSPATGLADATPAYFNYVLSNGTASSASASVTLSVPGTSYTRSPATLRQGGIVDNLDGGGKMLTFAAIPGFVYQVEASDDLASWTPLGSISAGADGRLIITDPGATEAARFYRFKK
jgi:uncharacterized delta-60 repeat protein